MMPPTSTATSLSLVCPFSGSATACRCVHRIHPSPTQSPWPFVSDESVPPSPSSSHQEIAWNLGGTVAKCSHREYGFAHVQINKFGSDCSSVDALFEGLGDEMEVLGHYFYDSWCRRLTRLDPVRCGCLMAIRSLRPLRNSTSSVIRNPRPMLPLPITRNRSTVFNSIQR